MSEGRRIAERYELVTELGAGGMGVVWRARDHRLGRDVALKVLAAGAVGNTVARARLVREARAAAGLQHEGIVHVYDVGETEDGGAFLVMELVAGRSLRTLLEEGALSFREKVQIVIGIGEALGHAHDEGIIHRDVKPDNVLIRKNGRPVVLDFGLAKPVPLGLAETIAEGDHKTLTQEGHIVGTPAYLAPEQIRGGTVGPRSDQFALAVTAFELFTGRLPWKGNAVLEVLASMLADAPLRADDESDDVDRAAADVLDRALKKDADERWESVVAFANALGEACGVAPRSVRTAPSNPAEAPPANAKTHSVPPPSSNAKAPTGTPAKSIIATTDSVHVSTPVAAAAAPSRPWRPRLARAAIIGVVGAVVVFALRASDVSKQSAADAAAAPPAALGADAVVACPIFDVDRADLAPPRGWLGAAAAALACDHAQVLLGGLPERTLGPAELVAGIPREPAEDAPLDPFSAEGARDASLKSAETRKAATITGTVGRDGNSVTVKLVVKSNDGREIAHGDGSGHELFVAVSRAMRATRSAFALREPSAFQKEWIRVRSIEAAEDYLDATVAVLTEDNVEIAAACDRFTARTDVERDMLYFVRAACVDRLKRASLDEPPPAIDEGSLGALVTTVAAHRVRGGPAETKARIEKLTAVTDRVTKPAERAILSGTIAELAYLAGDGTRAASVARMAIQASPKLVDLRGTPWHRLAFASQFDRSIATAHASWLAWEPVAAQNAGSHGVTVIDRTKVWARGYELGRRGYFATAYAEGLARVGDIEKARGIAEQLDSDHLRVRVLVAQTLFRKAIEVGIEVLRKLPDDNANAGNAYRILASITEASRWLGKKPEFSEEFFAKYLFADPPRLKVGVVPFTALVYACADAPSATAKKCVKRLREAYSRGEAGAVVGAAPALLEGAQYWVDGNPTAAANSWRPLLRESGAFLEDAFRLVMLEAFDAGGAPDLADRIDTEFLPLVDHPRAIDFSLVRAAKRAEKRGDTVQARKLAQHMYDALQFSDGEVPASKDLDALLKRLPPK